MGRRDVAAALALLALFALLLAATWNRWTNPIIDHGRELNVPARLLAGERLYLDIYYFYGPVAPYVGAGLYALFGTHMAVLHATGMGCAVVILATIYWIARQLLAVVDAALATALVLVLCALPPYLGNYVQPYAYAALYGWTSALLALAGAIKAVTSPSRRWFILTGVAAGLAAACKPELGLLAGVPALTAWGLASLTDRRTRWSSLRHLGAPAVVVVVLTYGPVLALVPWQILIGQTVDSFQSPQMLYFSRSMSGLRQWPATGWAILASLGLCALACGLSGLGGLLIDGGRTREWPRAAWQTVVLLSIGAGLYAWAPVLDPTLDLSPLRSAPLVVAAATGTLGWRVLRATRAGDAVSTTTSVLIVLGVFSLISMARMLFNVSLKSPYTMFAIPTAIVVYVYLLQRVWPTVVRPSALGRSTAAAGVFWLTSTVVAMALFYGTLSRTWYDTEIKASRGVVRTRRQWAGPINQAIGFARVETGAGTAVAILPEGSFINFMAERSSPLPDEIVVPGYLTPPREQETIARLERRQPPVLLLLNRLTLEYRDAVFGVDYNTDLMRWIDERYTAVATFAADGRDDAALPFGAREFFIRAYSLRPPAAADGPARSPQTWPSRQSTAEARVRARTTIVR